VERPQALRQIVETLKQFDRGNSTLRVIYCRYFAPDPNPEKVWAIHETVQWISVAPREKPLEASVVLIPGQNQRSGLHWETPPQAN